MLRIILVNLLLFSSYILPQDKYEKYSLEDRTGFSPIKYEPQVSRYDDKDISDIFHGHDLRDHGTPDCGPTPSPEPDKK